MFEKVLVALHGYGCRFVVVGSTARALIGDAVVPSDIDIVIDPSPDGRRRLLRALTDLDAMVETRNGWRQVARCPALPWEWGFRAFTSAGQVDIVTRFVDGTTIDDHDAQAATVWLEAGFSVRVRPTRQADAA